MAGLRVEASAVLQRSAEKEPCVETRGGDADKVLLRTERHCSEQVETPRGIKLCA